MPKIQIIGRDEDGRPLWEWQLNLTADQGRQLARYIEALKRERKPGPTETKKVR